MIEHSHLTIIEALHTHGTLTEAANTLCLSQSALSHQIGYLEKKLGVALWKREGRNLRLTQAGMLLLEVAQQILPVLAQAEKIGCVPRGSAGYFTDWCGMLSVLRMAHGYHWCIYAIVARY